MEQTGSILIIEDDESICQVISAHLQREGLTTRSTPDGAEGLELALSGDYSVIILDLGLRTLGGFDVCRRLRNEKPLVPIIILTSRNEEIDKVVGLELGADDYVTKPFSAYELTARIRSQIRRLDSTRTAELGRAHNDDSILRFKSLEIDLVRRKVHAAGIPVELTVKEFDLLSFLAKHPGRPFTREILLEAVWNVSAQGYADAVGSLILRLRKKIEPNPEVPQYILTARGIGYRFAELHELDDRELADAEGTPTEGE